MKRTTFILMVCLLIGSWSIGLIAKETKLAYVDSEKILEANDDYKASRQKLQEEERDYLGQSTTMEKSVKAMADELQAQSLMLSPEARKERETRYYEKSGELEKFRKEIWGEGGKLYSRNLELSRPILDKINAAIAKIAQEDGYDFVFDAASANIVFALPEHDITDRVVDALKKE